MAKCPMCGAKTARKQLMCYECGFALPSHGDPLLGPPPNASTPSARPLAPTSSSTTPPPASLPVTASPAVGAPAILEERVPSTRETNRIVGLIMPVAVLVLFGFGRSVQAFAVFLLILTFIGIPALWSLFGWERILIFGDHIEVRRVIFGKTIRYITLPWEAVTDITYEESSRPYFRGKDRGALWFFGTGPVVISHVAGTYRIAEGYEYFPDKAEDLAKRLRAAMDSVAPASSSPR